MDTLQLRTDDDRAIGDLLTALGAQAELRGRVRERYENGPDDTMSALQYVEVVVPALAGSTVLLGVVRAVAKAVSGYLIEREQQRAGTVTVRLTGRSGEPIEITASGVRHVEALVAEALGHDAPPGSAE
ncbi:effector-associated constant component EACC1 [Micromonospora sp. WMMD735]|uniref:effector-associated constant component EACC1 n=1 Tax=Micromonospora sp. WMMD735 TaxID=3404130 RepID=UPI003B935A8B